jgi:hypothetical protein
MKSYGMYFMSESTEQAQVVAWFRAKYPKYLIFAIPNGTHIKSHAGRSKAKREGLLAGVPDLMIPAPSVDIYHGLFIEMKDIKKTQCSVSANQKDKLAHLDKLGYYTTWCAGADDAKKVIDDYMKLAVKI